MGGSFDLQPYQKLPPYFHWVQAAPTRHRDRSHWLSHIFIEVYNTLPKNPYENWQTPAIKSLQIGPLLLVVRMLHRKTSTVKPD